MNRAFPNRWRALLSRAQRRLTGGPDVDELATRVTHILRRCGSEDRAWEELLPLIYDELHGIARRRMAGERAEHTLQATALVNEAYLRLVEDRGMDWRSRRHFYGAAGEAMRRVLIDHARRRKSDKRAGGRARASISLDALEQEEHDGDAVALAEGLARLREEDSRAAEVVNLRFFAGLSVQETALALEVSERTVLREWAFARARLAQIALPPEG